MAFTAEQVTIIRSGLDASAYQAGGLLMEKVNERIAASGEKADASLKKQRREVIEGAGAFEKYAQKIDAVQSSIAQFTRIQQAANTAVTYGRSSVEFANQVLETYRVKLGLLNAAEVAFAVGQANVIAKITARNEAMRETAKIAEVIARYASVRQPVADNGGYNGATDGQVRQQRAFREEQQNTMEALFGVTGAMAQMRAQFIPAASDALKLAQREEQLAKAMELGAINADEAAAALREYRVELGLAKSKADEFAEGQKRVLQYILAQADAQRRANQAGGFTQRQTFDQQSQRRADAESAFGVGGELDALRAQYVKSADDALKLELRQQALQAAMDKGAISAEEAAANLRDYRVELGLAKSAAEQFAEGQAAVANYMRALRAAQDRAAQFANIHSTTFDQRAKIEADANAVFGLGGAFDQLRASLVPAAAEALKLELYQKKVNDALSQGAINATEAKAAMQAYREELGVATSAADKFAEGQRKVTQYLMAQADAQRRANQAGGVGQASTFDQRAKRQADLESVFGEGGQTDQNKARFNPIFANSQQYAADLKALQAEADSGRMGATAYAAALDHLNESFAKLNGPLKSHSALVHEAEMRWNTAYRAAFEYNEELKELSASQRAGYISGKTYTDQVNKLTEALDKTLGLTPKVVHDLDALRYKYDSLYRVSKDYEKALDEIGILQGSGKFNATHIEQMMEGARQGFIKAQSDVAKGSTTFNKASFLMQQFGIQLIDVFQQIGSGAPVMTTFIQQGGQVAQVAAVQGNALNLLGSAWKFLISPIGLVIAATTLVVAALTAAAVASESNARRMGLLRTVLSGVRDDYRAAAVAADEAGRKIAANNPVNLSQGRQAANQIFGNQAFEGSPEQAAELATQFERLSKVLGETENDWRRLDLAMKDPIAVMQELSDKQIVGFNQNLVNNAKRLQESGEGAKVFAQLVDLLRARTGAYKENLTPLEVAMARLHKAFYDASGGASSFADKLGAPFLAIARGAINMIALYIETLQKLYDTGEKVINRFSSGPTSLNGLGTTGGGVPGAPVTQGGQGVGLFQLEPAAAKDVRMTPEDRFDYQKNVIGGVSYFFQKLQQMGNVDDATRAYNAGTEGAKAGRGQDYLAKVQRQSAAQLPPEVRADIEKAFGTIFHDMLNDPRINAARERILQIAMQESSGHHFVPARVSSPAGLASPTGLTEDKLATIKRAEDNAIALGLLGKAQDAIIDKQNAFRKALELPEVKASKEQTDLYTTALKNLEGQTYTTISVQDQMLRGMKLSAETANVATEGSRKLFEQQQALDELDKQRPDTAKESAQAELRNKFMEQQHGLQVQLETDLQRQIKDQQELARAQGLGAGEVARSTAAQQAYLDTIRLFPLGSKEAEEALKRLTGQYVALSDQQKRVQAAQQSFTTEQQINAQNALTKALREGGAAAANTEAKNQALQATLALFPRTHADFEPTLKAFTQQMLDLAAATARSGVSQKVFDTTQQIEGIKRVAEAWQKGGGEAARTQARVEAMQEALKAGEKDTPAYTAALEELTERFLKLGEEMTNTALAQQKFSVRLQITQNNELADAWSKGAKSATEVTAEQQAFTAALGMSFPTVEAFKQAVKDLTQQNLDLAASQQRIASGQEQLANDNTRQYIDAESASLGTNAGQRRIMLEHMKNEQDIKMKYPTLSAAEQAARLAERDAISAKTYELEKQQRALDEVTGMFEQSFDTIGNAITQAFVNGQGAAVNFKNVMTAVSQQILQQFIKLAILNPIMNQLFGTDKTDITDVFKATSKASQNQAASGQSAAGIFGTILGLVARGASIFGGAPSATSLSNMTGATATGLGASALTAQTSMGGSGILVGGVHSGGRVGIDPWTFTRTVSDAAFANAPRYHSGLASDEFAAILQRGERVLTAKQDQAVQSVIGGAVTKPANSNEDKRSGAPQIVFNITTPNADSFMRSQTQIVGRTAAVFERTQRKLGQR